MNYAIRYVQFNDLVFDDYHMVGSSDGNYTEFKVETTPYKYGDGSYAPIKSARNKVSEKKVSLTLILAMRKLPCEYRPYYPRFAIEQLSKPGKLWAVKNGELMWAFAIPTSYGENESSVLDTVEIDVDFLLYEGVWHKADKQRTFLQPFDRCTFMDCYKYKTLQPCVGLNGNCCDCFTDEHPDMGTCCECVCHVLDKEMALCYHLDDLEKFYGGNGCMGSGYRTVYDCEKGQEFFGDLFLGQKLCTKDACAHIIAGQFYAETDIATENVTIVLNGGTMHNPYIEINGNGNYIEGDYDGMLRIEPNGDVYFGSRCCDELVDPAAWKIPEGMTYGWTIHPRNNRILIDAGSCCGTVCAYLQIDNLTI